MMNRFELDFARVFGGQKKSDPDPEQRPMRITLPSKRLTDPDFHYTPACATDLRETFRRVREEQRRAITKTNQPSEGSNRDRRN
jgi:hypothetical protein